MEDRDIFSFDPSSPFRFEPSSTYDDNHNDLEVHKISIFKSRVNELFSRMGYYIHYTKPFKVVINGCFICPPSINHFRTFKLEQCVICLEKEPKVLFCNCGHICICDECFFKKLDNCPVCKEINTILRVIE